MAPVSRRLERRELKGRGVTFKKPPKLKIAILKFNLTCYNRLRLWGADRVMNEFILIDKIDKAVETKEKCTVIHKMGKYYHGVVHESWIRMSGGKMRGKIRFESEEKGEIEIDANDILELLP
jgi:hypothetical protein